MFLVCSGCGSTDSQTGAQALDASAATEVAFTTYDSNGDKKLNDEELDNSIALKKSLRKLDANRDEAIEVSELTDRLKSYSNSEGDVYVSMFLMKRGRPLEEAKVTLEPEVFMGPNHAKYKGATDSFGAVIFEDINVADGLQPGFYKILVTSKDGEEFTDGCEIAKDIPSMSRMQISL